MALMMMILLHIHHAVVLVLLVHQFVLIHVLEVLLVVTHLGGSVHQIGVVHEKHLLIHVVVSLHAIQLVHLGQSQVAWLANIHTHHISKLIVVSFHLQVVVVLS